MNLILVFAAVLAVIFIVTTNVNKKQKKTKGPISIKRKQVMTNREHEMFKTLETALPECVLLAQVSFSALITSDTWDGRNTFNRKVADFVICSKNMAIIAIIELDDRSHIGREQQDKDRDNMLKQAGYTTIRYPVIPATEIIRRDIENLLLAQRRPQNA